MMSSGAATMPQECNCFAVRSAARHVTQFYDQHLASSGLRTTQFSILSKLKRKGPMTINRLAEDMAMDRTTLGRNILPLERDGLIRIEPAAHDRRAKELHLTAAGAKRQRGGAQGMDRGAGSVRGNVRAATGRAAAHHASRRGRDRLRGARRQPALNLRRSGEPA